MRPRDLVGIGGLGAVMASAAALAHHAGNFFDDQELELTGTVKELQLTNPHSWLEVMVPSEDGAAVQWSVEMGAPIVMFRQGWTTETVQPGDEVTVIVHPMRDGRPGGGFVSITLPDGSVLGRGR